jgi:cobalt/nickel transport system permease protein
MHLGNGAITPECAALTYSVAAAGLVAGATALRSVKSEKLLHAAALGCAVFAAQAINVPITGGMSAHLVGGVLLAACLGPGLGVWTMALVLTLQTALLGDGGLAALGTNIVNMAVLPAGLVLVAKRLPSLGASVEKSPFWLASLSGLAVVLSAGLIVGETAMFRSANELGEWSGFASRMIGYHLVIGLLEAGATFAIVSMVRSAVVTRQWQASPRIVLGCAAALLLAAILLPISSSLPDGYEAAAESSGMTWLLDQ